MLRPGGGCDGGRFGIGISLQVEVEDGGQDGDDHAFLLVSFAGEQFCCDIPAGCYEVGGGYIWRKIPGAHISEQDVVIEPV